MKYGKGTESKDNSDTPKVLGLDPMGCLFALVSAIIGGVTDTIIFDNIAATAQKTAYPELALGLLMCAVFIASGGSLFAILSGLRKVLKTYSGGHRT
jgi:hypothetical protein